jgi:hypothetical protein
MSRRKRLVGNPLRGSRKILLDERVRTSQTFDKDIYCMAELPEVKPEDRVVMETKHYTDGSSATGIGPLPDLSPAQQDAKKGRRKTDG